MSDKPEDAAPVGNLQQKKALQAQLETERRFRLSAEGGWREANKVIAMQRERLDELEHVKAMNAALHNCEAVSLAKVEIDRLKARCDELEGLLTAVFEKYGYGLRPADHELVKTALSKRQPGVES